MRAAILLIIGMLGFLFAAPAYAASVNLISAPWTLSGNNGAAERSQTVNQNLGGYDTLQLNFDLHGLCLLGGDASAIILEQPAGSWHYVSLSRYAKNCQSGAQTVNIPLKDFPGLDLTKSVATFHVRFWYNRSFTIDLTPATILPATTYTGYKGEYWTNSQTLSGTPTLTRDEATINFDWGSGSPDSKISVDHFAVRWTKTIAFNAGTYTFTTISDNGVRLWLDNQILIDHWNDHGPATDTKTVNLTAGNHNLKMEYYENGGGAVAKFSYAPVMTTSTGGWAIQSVSSMKETKDKLCGQDDAAFIGKWLDRAKELGANYVAVETPYDSPACGNAVSYTNAWISAIRARGMKVWHRHMPLAFESIYNVPKTKNDFFSMISNYIKNNPAMFVEGDIFTPIPEPQNGGINGVTGCNGVCQFDSAAAFNKWLRDAMDTSETAFQSIGLGGKMKLGYYGFDGFITWGSNNPDWHGILEDATVAKMGHIAIDHYPELIGQTMKQGLDELQAKYPNTPIVISEWGSAGTTDVVAQVNSSMAAAKRPNIIGFNYWHMGMGGNEALINGDFSTRPNYSAVQAFFKGQK